MKQKVITISMVVMAFFMGVTGTYFVMDYVNDSNNSAALNKDKVTEIRNVTINDLGLKESVKKVYDAVVVIETYNGTKGLSSGTGFVYKTDDKYGYILTNQHVIEGGNKIKVTFTDGNIVDATIMGGDSYADIAVLRVDKQYVTQVAEIGKSTEMEIGDTVFTVGAPLGSEYSGTVTRGCISSNQRLLTVKTSNSSSSDWIMKVVQTDAAINPGNSGGPLVNVNGQVIGINSMKLSDTSVEGIGFAIPIEDAMEYAARFEKGEKIERPLVGIQMVDVNEAAYYNIYVDKNITKGAVIAGIVKNTPAAKADLKEGDIIVKIDDTEVISKAYLRYELYKHKVGDTIKLEIIRDGKTKTVSITLDKAS